MRRLFLNPDGAQDARYDLKSQVICFNRSEFQILGEWLGGRSWFLW